MKWYERRQKRRKGNEDKRRKPRKVQVEEEKGGRVGLAIAPLEERRTKALLGHTAGEYLLDLEDRDKPRNRNTKHEMRYGGKGEPILVVLWWSTNGLIANGLHI